MLTDGELKIGDRTDLDAVAVPLFLLAGETDHVASPDQVFALGYAWSRRSPILDSRWSPDPHS